ncbi:hypothetical protein ABIA30_001036 [Mycobacterium sp. MAA66]|uniref:hypothetical protein n=1 Tax=Mycobacterium sp. MAA66 TaxID=3156297 RepID=UPI0035112580
MSRDQVGDASRRATPPVRHEWVAGPTDARLLAGPIAIRSLGTARVAILMVVVMAAVGALVGPRWALVEAAVLLALLPLTAWLRTYLRLRRTVGPSRRWRSSGSDSPPPRARTDHNGPTPIGAGPSAAGAGYCGGRDTHWAA